MRTSAPALTAALALVAVTTVAGAPGPALAPVAGAAEAPVALNDCAGSDNGDPVVTGLELSPRTVDVTRGAKVVTIAVNAEDTGGPGPATGIAAVSARLGSGPSTSTSLRAVSPGRWEGRFRLAPGGRLTGTQPVSVSLLDRSDGGGVTVTSDELAAAGLPHELRVKDRNAPDRRRPQLVAMSLSRTSVDTRARERTVVVRARLRDALSGVGGGLVSSEVGQARLRLASGSRADGEWKARLTVGRWVGTRTARIYVVRVFDRAGNRHHYTTTGLQRRGLPHRFDVVARTDDGPPSPTLVSAPPATLDVRTADVSFPVRFRVVDDASGVAAVRGLVVGVEGSPSAGPPAPLSRVTGSARDGVWEGTVTVSRCLATTGDWFLQARATDVRGSFRTRTFTGAPVAVTASDRSPAYPVRGGVVTWGPPTQLRVDFAEDVVGLSATSAVLRRTTFRPTHRVETVSGSWTCQDASGSPSDCVTGPVRSAVATLGQQPAAGASYDVVLNPEHVLDVRDLAGNPYRRLPVLLGSRADLP
jgi:hypothetical protein